MKWILQDKNYALGNFINITPIIKHEYIMTGRKVDVYFETEYVKKAYQQSKYINILDDKPDTEPFASSSIINKNDDLPDYKYAFEKVLDKKYIDLYHPFIDEYEGTKTGKLAVILNGSGSLSEEYVESKNPGSEIYQLIIDKLKEYHYTIIFAGTKSDESRIKDVNGIDMYYLENIPNALCLIKLADIVIGNDTGLIHAAGCFNVPTFVLWKDTKRIKNMNSGHKCFYSYYGWYDAFKKWIETV